MVSWLFSYQQLGQWRTVDCCVAVDGNDGLPWNWYDKQQRSLIGVKLWMLQLRGCCCNHAATRAHWDVFILVLTPPSGQSFTTKHLQSYPSIIDRVYPKGREGAGTNASWYWVRRTWKCHQPITGPTYRDKPPFTHIHTYGQFRVSDQPTSNLHVFLWEEAEASRKTHKPPRNKDRQHKTSACCIALV